VKANAKLLINPKNVPRTRSAQPPVPAAWRPVFPAQEVSWNEPHLQRKVEQILSLGLPNVTVADCHSALIVAGFNLERATDLLLDMAEWPPLTDVPFSYADVAFLNEMRQIGAWSPEVILHAFETSDRDPERGRLALRQLRPDRDL
jgi:hypothetical protein